MSVFVLDFYQQACVLRLNDRVAQAVRELWSKSHSLMGTCSSQLKDAAAFKEELEHDIEDVLESAMVDGRVIAREELKGLDRVTFELAKSLPIDDRIRGMSIFIIRKQVEALYRSLMDFTSKFGKRKLTEVLSISVQQYTRRLREDDKLLVERGGPCLGCVDSSLSDARRNLDSALKRLGAYIGLPSDAKSILSLFSSTPCRIQADGMQLEFQSFGSVCECDILGEILRILLEVIDAVLVFVLSSEAPEESALLTQSMASICRFILQEILKNISNAHKQSLSWLDIEVSKMLLMSIGQLLILDDYLENSDPTLTFPPSAIFIEYYRCRENILSSYGRSLAIFLKPSYMACLRATKGLGAKVAILSPRLIMFLKGILEVTATGRELISDHSLDSPFPCVNILKRHKKAFPSDFYAVLLKTAELGSAREESFQVDDN